MRKVFRKDIIRNDIIRVMRLCTRQWSRFRGFNRKGKLTDLMRKKITRLGLDNRTTSSKRINKTIGNNNSLIPYCRLRLI
jgi:hypothetical protein